MFFRKKKSAAPDDPIAKLREWIEAIVIAVILALFIRSFVVQAFKIPSGSMLETLQIGDHLLVTRFSYDIKVPFTNISILPTGDPDHGDIIVFEYPENPSMDFIKRIIGLPGDRIEIRDKVVYRNGQALDEAYIQHSDPRILPSRRDFLAEFTVPENKYFVMGDNRDDSRDSRFWGFVDREAIIGKAWILYWSWDHLDSSVRWNRIGDLVR
ncbi:signal peptidase I [Paucidesulfovibrio gracilis DSM 16080]|uniref:Signal peptidase I n=1 Tax=Paucidesulfovibrio gracilis DSM 16080 TaxID=1121449 RepID=A0A1T4XZ12_9BACT|nr:signal peptidase I [Paucidesulfovibrio gracilis]SKA94458.1 signal peptidase I [Paucidesulfovibrio gracilis DSM 16080]